MFPLSEATGIAENLVARLSTVCDKIQIAGSIRRGCVAVRDIDLVLIPRFTRPNEPGLLGAPQNLLVVRLAQLVDKGLIAMESNGPKYKRFTYAYADEPVPVDLYIGTPETWWTLVLVRTGSRVHNLGMAGHAIERHMVLKGDGSGLISTGGLPIPVKSEEEIFQILGVPYRAPEERE